MARIRTVKPEFWQDEKLAPCDPLTRLVFLGLIGMADDAGRLLDNEKIIDAFIFPESSHSCREALATLSRMGRVIRGQTASGQRVIQIANWDRHQRVDRPNLASALPELVAPEEDAAPRADGASDSREDREPLAPRSTTYDQRSTTTDRRAGPRRDDDAKAIARFLEVVPPTYHEAVEAAFHAAHQPSALRRELEAIVSGMHPPAYDHATIGRALHEMAIAGTPVRAVTIRAFCRRLTQPATVGDRTDEELFGNA